jgi:hypothetical protein
MVQISFVIKSLKKISTVYSRSDGSDVKQRENYVKSYNIQSVSPSTLGKIEIFAIIPAVVY